MPDAGNINTAKVIARPRLADAQPAGVRFTVFTIAIPDEANFHPAIFIRPDLFARRADDDGGLRPARAGPRRLQWMTIDFAGWLYEEATMPAIIFIAADLRVILHLQMT